MKFRKGEYLKQTTDIIIEQIHDEIIKATNKFDPFNSQHEGYAVLLEEVDELWEEVKKNPKVRSKDRMREEAIQVAAMAIRFIVDVCGDES